MHVREIWRFPVKSMGGETLSTADVGELGIVGDRGWSVYDVDTTTTLTARRIPELLFASARIVDHDPVIVLPDGSEIGPTDHARLSAWLGRDVELRAADATSGNGDPAGGGTYEAPLDAENEANWVSWTGPGGAFHDSGRARVSLVSTTTLRDWDHRRFRPNLVVEGGGEDELVGGRVRIGNVVLDVVKQIDRCVMVTRSQPGIERDLAILTTINAERARLFAVGCLVVESGEVTLGDPVSAPG